MSAPERIAPTGDRADVLVIGSGPAGMQAALVLAELGRRVHLVERRHAIGGFFPLLDKTFPTNSCGVCFMSPVPPARCPIHECRLHRNIELYTGSEVVALEGEGGDFTATLLAQPRFVDPEKCTLCGKCLEACPEETADEFGDGLERRRALYRPFPQAIPPAPVIDAARCTRCGRCVAACPAGAIDLDMPPRRTAVRAGAVVLGAGFEAFPAGEKGEFGFGRYPNVLSAVQFERMLSTSGPTGGVPRRPSDGRPLARVAFLQCVGSREPAFGRPHCSTVCCMYALKQALIARERLPGLSASFFHMDLRPMGKGYQRYADRAAKDHGIALRLCSVSAVKELPGSRDLLVTSVTDRGGISEETFDAVVLATGFTPPSGAGKLAATLGIELGDQGWCRGAEFEPGRASRPGIFVGGGFRGPRDIPEAVTEGAGAAAEAAAYLGPVARSEAAARPVEGALAVAEPRVGLFVFDPGGVLAAELDLDALVAAASRWSGVGHAALLDGTDPAAVCSGIKALLGEHGLNRLVLAGRVDAGVRRAVEETAREIGLAAQLVEFADLDLHCAAVHRGNRAAGSAKAVALARMAFIRALHAEHLAGAERAVGQTVMVVGGGVAGMTAALRLARMGHPVRLLERENELGGNLRLITRTLRGSDPRALLRDLQEQVAAHPGIGVSLGARVTAHGGEWGAFRTTFRSGGEEHAVDHGALILATGGREISPAGLYLYGDDPRVVTQRGLERLLEAPHGVAPGASVVMIQCAGSRDEARPWCSHVCCGQAVKNALRLTALDPGARVWVLHRDIRTYGAAEASYQEARRRGVIFIRYGEDRHPHVSRGGEGEALRVSVFDASLGRQVDLDAGLVVLSAGIEPGEGSRETAALFGLALDEDGFFQEANPKAAPLDALERGKYFCGLCHSPNFLEDAISQGSAAAARAAALLAGGRAEAKTHRVDVAARLCAGCGLCVEVCPYGARFINEDRTAGVREFLCQGCGSCAAVCRNGATRQRLYRAEVTLAVIDAALD